MASSLVTVLFAWKVNKLSAALCAAEAARSALWDHLIWAIGLLTLIPVCLSGLGLKQNITVLHFVTSRFQVHFKQTCQSNSHTSDLFLLTGGGRSHFQESGAGSRSETGVKWQPNLVSGWSRGVVWGSVNVLP